jgi:hypothetical protein
LIKPTGIQKEWRRYAKARLPPKADRVHMARNFAAAPAILI